MLPPNHRADCQPVFIPVRDPAWDHKRIGREERIIMGVEKLPEDAEPLPWLDIMEYPLTRYWSGESRGDLDTIRDWLLPDSTPTMFVLRRLPLARWIEVKQLQERRLDVAARVHALRHALVSIDNGPKPEIKLDGDALDDDALDAVRALLGDDGFAMLCRFAIQVSAEPGPTELPR